MRRFVILALLYLGVQLMLTLGEQGHGSEALVTFGFLVLAAYTVGELTVRLGLPKIVGYLFAGMAFGPSALSAVTTTAIGRLAPVNDLAIALIAFLAGAELRWSDLRASGSKLVRMLGCELMLSLLGIAGLLVALHRWIPFLAGAPHREVRGVRPAVLEHRDRPFPFRHRGPACRRPVLAARSPGARWALCCSPMWRWLCCSRCRRPLPGRSRRRREWPRYRRRDSWYGRSRARCSSVGPLA